MYLLSEPHRMQSDALVGSDAEPPQNEIGSGQNSFWWKDEHDSNFGEKMSSSYIFTVVHLSPRVAFGATCVPQDSESPPNTLESPQLTAAPQQRWRLLVSAAGSWDLFHLFCESQRHWNNLGYIRSQKVTVSTLCLFGHVSLPGGSQGYWGNTCVTLRAYSQTNKQKLKLANK